jgi:hypothetical protein
MDYGFCALNLNFGKKTNCLPRMEKFERRMLDIGPCTIRGEEERRRESKMK